MPPKKKEEEGLTQRKGANVKKAEPEVKKEQEKKPAAAETSPAKAAAEEKTAEKKPEAAGEKKAAAGEEEEELPPADEESLRGRIINAQKKRREQRKARLARNEREKETDSDADDFDEREEEEEEAVASATLFALFVGSLFFISLPLGEEVIDYVQVALFVIVNFTYCKWCLGPGYTPVLMWLAINVIMVEHGPNVYYIPDFVMGLPPVETSAAVSTNVAVFGAYFWFVLRTYYNNMGSGTYEEKEQKKKFNEWLDYGLTGLMGLNLLMGIFLGYIPASVVYVTFKKILGLLTNFSVD